jgi:Zn-dependent protease
VSFLTAALFFVTLVAHELSHAMVARARGIPVKAITLFALGGIANISKDANSAKTEFLIAIVGPITSFAIGFGAIGLAQAMGWTAENGMTTVAASVLGWLGSINVLLAAFNLIPGYPLDGGRVLRSILWAIYTDGERATRHAARVGQGIAGLFIAIGVFRPSLARGSAVCGSLSSAGFCWSPHMLRTRRFLSRSCSATCASRTSWRTAARLSTSVPAYGRSSTISCCAPGSGA